MRWFLRTTVYSKTVVELRQEVSRYFEFDGHTFFPILYFKPSHFEQKCSMFLQRGAEFGIYPWFSKSLQNCQRLCWFDDLECESKP